MLGGGGLWKGLLAMMTGDVTSSVTGETSVNSIGGGTMTADHIIAALTQILGPTIVNSSLGELFDYSGSGVLKNGFGSEFFYFDTAQFYSPSFGNICFDVDAGVLYDLAGTISYYFSTREMFDENGDMIMQYVSLGITLKKKIIEYNADTTAGNGLAYIKYVYNPTGQTAVVNNNYTTVAAAGQYRISIAIVITGTWTTGTMDAVLSWNNGTAKTKTIITALSMTTIGNENQYVGTFDVAASTTINLTTTFTGNTGSGSYRIKSIIERIG